MSRRPRKQQAVKITPHNTSEELYQALFEQAADGIFIADPQGHCIEVNRHGCEMLGYTREELLGLSIGDLITAEDLAHNPRQLDELRADKIVLSERHLRRKDGRWLPVEINAQALSDGNLLGIVRDITERKQAEEMLQKSHEELRAFFSQTIDGCFFMMLDEPMRWDETTDKEGVLDYVFVHQRITQINEAMLAQYGATRQQMLNLTPNDFFQHNLAHGRDLWRQLFDAGKIRLESDERKLDGTPMWIEGEYIVLYDSEGRITGHFGIQRDVTERKRAEEELQQSNDLLRAIIEAAPTAIIGLDLDGNVQMVWNPAAEKMLGWNAQEAMGRPLPSVPVENQEEFGRFRERMRSGLTLDGMEVRRQRRDGSPIDYSIYASPLRDAEGQITGNIAVLVDITERKQAEQSIALMNFALDNVHEAAFLVDENMRTHYVNEEACRVLGYTREELLGLSVAEVDPDFPAERWPSHWDELKTRRSLTFESRHKTKDGRLIPVEINANYIEYDGQGYILGLVRDITERKRAEETLREKQNQLLEAQHIARIGNWWHDLVTGELYWSDEIFRAIGIEPQKPTAEFVAAIVHPDDWHILQQAMDEAAAGKAELEHEFRIVRPDGGIRWIHNRWVGIYDEAGKEIKRIGTHQDITERKKAEEEHLAHLRFLESMDQVNRAIQETRDLDSMISDILNIVHSIFDCDRVFLLYPCDPSVPTFQVIVEAYKPEYPGAFSLNMEIPVTATQVETISTVLKSETPVVMQSDNFQRLEFETPIFNENGFIAPQSALLMAIKPKTDIPWMFGLHQCSYLRVWTSEEERLFQEIGNRLGDALTSLLSYRNLQESEERYRLVFENSPVSLWEEDFSEVKVIFDELKSKGVNDIGEYFDQHPETFQKCAEAVKFVNVNQSTVELHEATTKQEFMSNLADTITPEALENFRKGLECLWNGDTELVKDSVIKTLKGNRRHVTAYLSICPGYEKTFSKTLASLIDITERKAAEESLRQLNIELDQRVLDRTAQLEAVNKELEAFAYSISHDLRAPLRHIDGFLELFQQSLTAPLDERSRHYMTNIADAVGRMGTLIDDLLSFSRMGRNEMSKMPVNLNVLTQEIVQELASETQDRTINWHIADLPTVTGDQAMLRQALVNLISNALKFTGGRPQAEIEVGYQTGEKETVIFVRDNGVGFDMAYADKLFGVFQRLHRADEFEGVGIGLANVRRIINRHGGRTWAEGETDRGATFYFSLPTLK